jgi:undecaprenyl-diphosphatase
MSLGVTATWDSAGMLEMLRIRTPGMTQVMQGITAIGGGGVLASVAMLCGIWLGVRRSRRDAAGYLGAVVLGWACYGLLKWAFGRPRPTVIERLADAGWYSFPSGHAMMSAVILGLAVLLLTERRMPRGAVGLLVALIAFSRVYLGVHYPSDVVAGLLAGTGWVLGVRESFRGGSDRLPPGSGVGTLPSGRTSGSDGGL